MSANTFNPMLMAIARKVLPAGARRVLRRLLVGSPQLSISYELISQWPDAGDQPSWVTPSVTARFKEGVETFDLNTVKQSPEAAFQSPIVRDNVEALNRTGLSEATLLDFGCGNGLYRPILAAFPATTSWKYVGADVSAELVELCRAMHPDTRFELVEEGSPLPFQGGEFDIVLASGVVHYIQHYTTVLSELYRITRDYVLISRLPLWRYNPSQIVLQHVRHAWGEEHHPIHVFNRDALEVLFKELGFSISFRDYGSEFFYVPGVSEPIVHNFYILQKVR